MAKFPTPHIAKYNVARMEETLRICYYDLMAFGRFFLPGDFLRSEPAEYQYIMADEINSKSTKPCCIILPRGHIKTTLIKASIIHDFCYSNFANRWGFTDEPHHPNFYAWVAKSQDDSKDNVKYVSRHLTQNKKIADFFSDGKSMKGPIWNLEDITTRYGDRLMSSSNLKSVRGKTEGTVEHGAIRFGRVFADDFENEENTKTLQARESLKRTLIAGILPAIDISYSSSRLFAIGTPVHGDSFIQNMLEKWEDIKDDPAALEAFPWKLLVWRATQPTMPGGVLWNGWMDRKALNKKLEEYKAAGKEELYWQEYELNVAAESMANWTKDHYTVHDYPYFYDNENGYGYIIRDGVKYIVETYLGCDPATDIATKTSDFSAISVIAVDEFNNRISLASYKHRSLPASGIRDTRTGKLIDPNKFGVVDKIIEMYDQYHCRLAAVEDVAMTRSIMNDMNKAKQLMNRFDVRVAPVKPGGKDKHNRIYSFMNAMFTNGQIYLRKEHSDLITQILTFGPKMAHDDVIDSFYMANLYARPPVGFVKEESKEAGKVQYSWRKKTRRPPKDWITL